MSQKPVTKLGQGHLKAAVRQGFKEIAQILPAFPAGSVHLVEEQGLVGNPTPQEVTQDKGMQQSYQSMLNSYAGQSKGEPERQVPER